jgi:hypothetical protein
MHHVGTGLDLQATFGGRATHAVGKSWETLRKDPFVLSDPRVPGSYSWIVFSSALPFLNAGRLYLSDRD